MATAAFGRGSSAGSTAQQPGTSTTSDHHDHGTVTEEDLYFTDTSQDEVALAPIMDGPLGTVIIIVSSLTVVTGIVAMILCCCCGGGEGGEMKPPDLAVPVAGVCWRLLQLQETAETEALFRQTWEGEDTSVGHRSFVSRNVSTRGSCFCQTRGSCFSTNL